MSFEMPAIIHDRVFVLPEDESLELLGRLQYDDQGIDPREVRVELELSDELEELGARVEVEGYSRRDHHFPHSGVLRYGLRIPLGALEGVAGVLGQVQLYRLMSATEGDRRLEGRAEVRVGQVMRIGDLPPYPHEWVIDQGGHSTLVVSEHGVGGVR